MISAGSTLASSRLLLNQPLFLLVLTNINYLLDSYLLITGLISCLNSCCFYCFLNCGCYCSIWHEKRPGPHSQQCCKVCVSQHDKIVLHCKSRFHLCHPFSTTAIPVQPQRKHLPKKTLRKKLKKRMLAASSDILRGNRRLKTCTRRPACTVRKRD